MRIRDEKKEQLVIDKAIDLFVAEGFDGFSMNKLAKACGISVATLYIYYKDKEDLIRKIAEDVGDMFFGRSLQDFTPDMPFAEGLRKQWENRVAFAFEHPREVAFFEILRSSPYAENVMRGRLGIFKEQLSEFYHNCIKNKELVPLSPPMFWCMAYGPLYSMLRFHQEGKSMGGQPFRINKLEMDEALRLTVKALTP
ncbi:MAG: TetR/AcrR family transcriptional regulator [Flavobacterium sp.]|uniref:TetR/AcrR family transcriptional regulator n=1 Tax=Flavobacterium sp. TaxID=239 RepID=UPI001229788B|nr:TetR/AcrR family transcriptional regulator [Flavobacterium sp.]RZJ67466.1 MAG: TetR/AcrR family transcriptional regulator [Flavobacterium sp.]